MPLNIDFQQVLLHMLNFVILFGILYFLLYGPVKKFMDTRSQTYKDIDDQINKKLEDANQTKAEYEKKLENADNEIAKKLALAEAEAEKQAQEICKQAKSDAEKIILKAEAEAEKERIQLIESSRKEIAESASEMAEKIVAQSILDTYNQFISSAERGNKDA